MGSTGSGKPKSFLEIFKQRIKDNFVQEWHSRLENSTRARTFINITSFKYQPYLDIINVKKIQTSLSRLRIHLTGLKWKQVVGQDLRKHFLKIENVNFVTI